ncbi:DUF4097 family beta strand repeat-containing protein [Mycobacteroides sp. LB1]|uniref:DUF4097 family beta strand repeat-containing protein n=1 Tax=Mycobacteroides sp. LB1 TaxID=2750814 RepID=UPI0015E0132E|nr:DUF4097 family beta strand repeat protein [Mycobacteroides sp. LB1]
MSKFETLNPVAAKVALARGTLQIIASDRANTTVDVRPRDVSKALDIKTAERTRVTFGKGLLSVESSPGLTFRTGTVDIIIELPTQSVLDISVASAEVRADGAFGDVRLQSASGDLLIDTITGDAKIDSASGGVSIRELTGDIGFQTARGDLAIKQLRGNIKAASSSGSVTIGSAIVGGLIFDTASGNTSVGIPAGTAAKLAIDTANGVVTNSLDSVDGPLQGDERFLVQVRSASGDVELHRPVVLTS